MNLWQFTLALFLLALLAFGVISAMAGWLG